MKDLGIKIKGYYIPISLGEVATRNVSGVTQEKIYHGIEEKYGKLLDEEKEFLKRSLDDLICWKLVDFDGEKYLFHEEVVNGFNEKLGKN